MELTGIKRLLVPAAWTLVVAHVLLQGALVLPLVSRRGFEFDAGPAWLSALLALIIGLAVCWADAERGARPVAIAALVVIGTGTAVLLGLGAISVAVILSTATAPAAVIGQLLLLVSTITVPVLSIVALVRLLPLTAGAPASVPPALPAVPEPETPAGRAPVWQPDRAVGAAWHTAGAAAMGAAADWGRPGERGGWTAAGRPPGAGPSEHGLPEGARPSGPALSQDTGPSGPGWSEGRPQQRRERAQPRPPVDFGPRAQPAAGPERSEDPDITRVAPDGLRGGDAAAATGRPEDLGPRAIGRRFAGADDDLTRPAPPGARRQPPRWTPLEDPTQPPPQP